MKARLVGPPFPARHGPRAAGFGALLLAATAAHADPPPNAGVRLSWVRAVGTESCPGVAALGQEVTRRLGRDPFTGDATRLIEGIASRDGARWLARIYVRTPAGALIGSREIATEAADCEPLAVSVALAVTLVVDPESALRLPPRTPPPPPPAPPAPTTTPPVAPRPSPVAAPVADRQILARVVGALGLLPVLAPGVALATEGPIAGPVRWMAGATLLPTVRTPAPDTSFAFGLTVAWVSACVDVLHHPRATLSACGGGLGGVMHAVVYEAIPTAPGDRGWAGLLTGARLVVRVVGPLSAEVGTDVVFPITRSEFVVSNRFGVVFQQPIATGLGYFGLGLRF